MAPERVEIHEVHEAETLEITLRDLDRLLHAVHRALRLVGLGEALPIEDIEDLADGNHAEARILQCIERRSAVRLQRIIVAVARALKLTLLPSHIRAGDDTADLPLILHRDLAGDLTAAVQLVKPEGLFIAADLQH